MDDMAEDFAAAYKTLGLAYGSPRAEVVAAFRRLALRWHPDRALAHGLAVEEAQRMFIELRRAYDVIADAGFPQPLRTPSPLRHRLAEPMPNISTWEQANARLRALDAVERAAARVSQQTHPIGEATASSERCHVLR